MDPLTVKLLVSQTCALLSQHNIDLFVPHFSPVSGAVSPPRGEGAPPPSSGPHPRLAMPAPLAVGGRLTLPGLLGQLPPPGWPHLPPALAGLNPALFKSGMTSVHTVNLDFFMNVSYTSSHENCMCHIITSPIDLRAELLS